jgi:hypothetical protein
MGDGPAAITKQHRFTPFHREQRDEKQAQIVIDAFQSSLRQSAGGAKAWGLIDGYRPGLDAAYEEKHCIPLLGVCWRLNCNLKIILCWWIVKYYPAARPRRRA